MCPQSLLQFRARALWKRRLRLAVDAEDLLTDGVSPSSQEAGLGRSTPVFNSLDSGKVHAFAAEASDESVSGSIMADRGYGQDARAECRQIIRRVCSAARKKLGLAVTKNQNRSFAGNPGNLAKLKFVGDEISENNDGLGGKLFDAVSERKKVDGG
jgi:hypothetical protein